jgi:putative membrane protein
LVGIIGISTNLRDEIIIFTPLNLFITFLVLIAHHVELKSHIFQAFVLLVFIGGMAIEIIGVNTGWPFGEYSYQEVLGPKILGVPWIIGLNWVLLVLSTGVVVNNLPIIFPVTKAFAGAMIMTLLDFWMEPIAVKLSFWTWENPSIPLSNYLAWWVISFIFFLFFFLAKMKRGNDLALTVLVLQFVFFGALNVLL